jgi:sphingomyelin phosphodiesterase acid-like 3
MAANHTDAMKKAGDIINYLVAVFDKAFPEVELIISLGNNDVVPDYYLQLQGETSNVGNVSMTPEDSGMLSVIYNALIDDGRESSGYIQAGQQSRGQSLLSAEDSSTYLKGGYYSRALTDGLTVLSMNTVLYSSFFGPEPSNADDPGEQFAWMREMLTNIRQSGNKQAIIVGHIPPVVGSFRHTQLWQEKYINVYFEIIREFDDVIVGQLFGHLHSDEFRVGVGKSAIPSAISTPLLLAGSLTPLHGNNPSFRKVFYGNDTGDGNKYRLLDYESHRYPISDSNAGEWSKLYTFSDTYSTVSEEIKAEGLSANVFRSILQSMKDKGGKPSPILQSFLSLVRSGSDGDVESSRADDNCDAECRAEWLCTLSGTTTANQYNECLSQERGSGWYVISLVATVLAIALFITTKRFTRRRRKRDQYDSIEGNVEMEQ